MSDLVKNLISEKSNRTVKRGDLFFADLSPVVGSEQGGVRPIVVVQNNIGNKHSPTIVCAAITHQMSKSPIPTHVMIPCGKSSLPKTSIVLLEQLRTIDKSRLKEKLGTLDEEKMAEIDRALSISLGLIAV